MLKCVERSLKCKTLSCCVAAQCLGNTWIYEFELPVHGTRTTKNLKTELRKLIVEPENLVDQSGPAANCTAIFICAPAGWLMAATVYRRRWCGGNSFDGKLHPGSSVMAVCGRRVVRFEL